MFIHSILAPLDLHWRIPRHIYVGVTNTNLFQYSSRPGLLSFVRKRFCVFDILWRFLMLSGTFALILTLFAMLSMSVWPLDPSEDFQSYSFYRHAFRHAQESLVAPITSFGDC